MQHNATESIVSGDVAGAEILPFGQELGGRYEIREALGVGGYAVVYRAFDRDLKREIALKVLRNDRTSPAAMTRFRREANVAREAASPHLLKIFDIAATASECFLTMELVRGESLRQRIARGPVPVDEAVDIALQILDGLQALHALNVIHRDLKPENVLIAGDGTVKVADFGLAYLLDEEYSRATATGALVGTTDYIPPEQALGTRVDARADLYALGIVLFEMLTGKLPFPRESSIGAVLARLRMRAPSARAISRNVPLWLATIIGRLLERDPNRRYASTADVAHALCARRVDVSRFLRPAFIAIPWILAIAGVWLFVPVTAKPQFARLKAVGDRGIAAIGRDGRTLWERTNLDPGIASTYALARITPGGPPIIATILGVKNDFSVRRMQTLSFVDPLTGSLVRRVHLPAATLSFEHDRRQFLVRSVHAVDLDGDGVDEIIVAFQHVPEAPSYVVLYEPRLDRARLVFIGYGNHDFAGVHDIDGDGKPELILSGINNGFDWFNAVAAVRIRPWIGEPGMVDGESSSPDLANGAVGQPNTLWYTLLPRGAIPSDVTRFVSFDDGQRRITLRLANGRRVNIDYDGFLTPSSRPVARREEDRNSAYEHYRESHRLFEAGFASDAIAEAERAVQGAVSAQDSILTEAMNRSLGQLLIRTGQVDRGVHLLETVAATSENASDIAFDAAVALHLHGDVARAVEWYRQGIGKGGSLDGGKSKHEFLQGIVLGLCELGRGSEAIPDIRRIQNAYSWSSSAQTALYLQFVRWRNGQRPSLDGVIIPPNATDLTRYWTLEFRSANSEPAEPLLKATNDLIAIGDDPQCVLWSLKAELLWRLGRWSEAAAAIRTAKDLLASERGRSVVARAHASIIEERFVRMTKEHS